MDKELSKQLSKRKNNKIKISHFLTAAEYIMLGISSALLIMYFLMLLIIFFSKQCNWTSKDILPWALIIVSIVISIVIGILVGIGIRKLINWLAVKLDALTYHFEKRGQLLIGIFLIVFALVIVNNSSIFSPNSKFLGLGVKSAYSMLVGISGMILSFLGIFDLNKILFYQLSIYYEVAKDDKVEIWATNTGSEVAGYRFEGLYDKNKIDKIKEDRSKNDQWVFWKDIKDIQPVCSNNSIDFENLDKGYTTKVITISKDEISQLANEKYYIIYSKSTGEIVSKSVSKDELLEK